jgi:hypothetical protein
MITEAVTQGHAGASGRPAKGMRASAITPAPIAMREVAETVSMAPLMAAFQPAWQAAARRTAAKTNESIRWDYTVLGARASWCHSNRRRRAMPMPLTTA